MKTIQFENDLEQSVLFNYIDFISIAKYEM